MPHVWQPTGNCHGLCQVTCLLQWVFKQMSNWSIFFKTKVWWLSPPKCCWILSCVLSISQDSQMDKDVWSTQQWWILVLHFPNRSAGCLWVGFQSCLYEWKGWDALISLCTEIGSIVGTVCASTEKLWLRVHLTGRFRNSSPWVLFALHFHLKCLSTRLTSAQAPFC